MNEGLHPKKFVLSSMPFLLENIDIFLSNFEEKGNVQN